MLHARAKNIIIIGLSKKNIEKMLNGEPAHIKLDHLGVPGVEMIMLAGETEESIAKSLADAGALDEKCIIIDERKKSDL